MKRLLVLSIITIFMGACGGADESKPTTTSTVPNGETTPNSENTDVSKYDPNRGSGKFTNVVVADKLDASMAAVGEKVYSLKCSGCHKLTDEKLVGPGWKGVTARHKAEWIMNFVTNTDEMITKDPKAQAQLELCLVRMPNQNLADIDARSLYELMRKNDGVQ